MEHSWCEQSIVPAVCHSERSEGSVANDLGNIIASNATVAIAYRAIHRFLLALGMTN
jgi:hypothetical protein